MLSSGVWMTVSPPARAWMTLWNVLSHPENVLSMSILLERAWSQSGGEFRVAAQVRLLSSVVREWAAWKDSLRLMLQKQIEQRGCYASHLRQSCSTQVS